MLKFLDAVSDSDEWERLAPKDPHFSPAYYRAFGGGELVVLEQDNLRIIQPFRYQGSDWIGNAYQYGGPVGSYGLCRRFALEFDEWKRGQRLNERCTMTPFSTCAVSNIDRELHKRDVVLCDLTAVKLRATTRHCVDKAIKAKATIQFFDHTATQNIELFEGMYDASMEAKKAKPHWRYKPGFFYNVLKELGPERSALAVTSLGGLAESACILINDHKVCYYHWASTFGMRKNDGANHYQVYSVMNWAKEKGLSYVHLGGGVDPAKKDSLMSFKAGFSPITRAVFSYETNLKGK